MSEKKSKKNKAGSVKQKPLVESKAVQLGKWVLGHELNKNDLALIRAHIENTVGSHRQDSLAKTRLRFYERGLASGDKPSILSFGLEQFYPIEDIKQLTRDETHTNVLFCIIKSPKLVYEVVAFRCPTEYEARSFADNFKKIKDRSGQGFDIDLKDPPDGQEMNWSMKNTGLRHVGDISAMSTANGNTYETVTVTEANGGLSNVRVDETTKTLHITTSEVRDQTTEDEETYATVDMNKKRAAREAAAAAAASATTTTTTVTEEVLPSQHSQQQTTTTVVKKTTDEPITFEVNVPSQEKTVEVRKETFVAPAQTQQQQTTVVTQANVVVPAYTTEQKTVVKESSVVVPAHTTEQTTVVKESNVVVPAHTTQQTRVVKDNLVVPGQTSHRVVRQTQSAPGGHQQTTKTVVKEAHAAPTTQQTTKVVKEVNAAPRQQQTQVVREVHAAPRNSVMVKDVEYNEVAVLKARVLSLEQENLYLRELLKQHSVNDKDLEVFMGKETVTNGPLMDSVVIVGDGHHSSQQTVKYSKQGEAAITVGDYRNKMSRADSDRSLGSFVKVRQPRGKNVMEDYVSGSLRSQQSGSLYASSIRGGSIYAEGQNPYAHSRVHGHHNQTALNMHHHSHHGDIITRTMATPNAGYLLVPQGTFKKTSKLGHTYITKPIEKVYPHHAPVHADAVDGSISISDDEEEVFVTEAPTPVKIV